MKSILKRATLIWLGLFGAAFINGAFREVIIKKVLSITDPAAHQISCFTGVIIWTLVVWTFWNKSGINTKKDAIIIGLYWFIMTVLAETFLINRLMGNLSWDQIFETYNVSLNSLWLLVVIWIGLLPLFMRLVRGGKNAI